MIAYLVSGGYAMWAVLFCGLVTIGTLIRAYQRGTGQPAAFDGVLFWGSAAITIGFIGTLIGVSSIATVMEAAGSPADAGLAWEGVRVALSTTVVGTAVFLVALAGRLILMQRPLA